MGILWATATSIPFTRDDSRAAVTLNFAISIVSPSNNCQGSTLETMSAFDPQRAVIRDIVLRTSTATSSDVGGMLICDGIERLPKDKRLG